MNLRKRNSLPKLMKKTLYLDQFAISNMMKALIPKTKAHQNNNVDEFWLELLQKLDRLIKLQLLVCPASSFHDEESIMSKFPEPLELMYQYLSRSVSFRHYHDVQSVQLQRHIKLWTDGREKETLSFNWQDVFSQNPHIWAERMLVTANIPLQEEWIEELRRSRVILAKNSREVTEKYKQQEQPFNFWDTFKEEVNAYLSEALESFIHYVNNPHGYPPHCVRLVFMAREALKSKGITGQEIENKMNEYFESEAIEHIPFNRIRAMLFASVARNYASGMKKQLTKSLINDINMISTYLPYCDAMLIDKECHGYLIEEPLRTELDYGCRVFSLNTKDDLLSYLQDIEDKASDEHKAKVLEVYGEEWLKPFDTLYVND